MAASHGRSQHKIYADTFTWVEVATSCTKPSPASPSGPRDSVEILNEKNTLNTPRPRLDHTRCANLTCECAHSHRARVNSRPRKNLALQTRIMPANKFADCR